MAHGLPDDSDVKRDEAVFNLQDMGELAVRLGSPMIYHRGGIVLFLETFEDGAGNWTLTATNAVYPIEPSPDVAHSNGISLRLYVPASASDYAEMQADLPYLGDDVYGFSMMLSTLAATPYIYHRIYVYTGTHIFDYVIRIAPGKGFIHVKDHNGAWQLIASGVNFFASNKLFRYAQLVIDWENQAYTRYVFGQTAYDLSGYLPQSALNGVTAHTELIVRVEPEAATAATVYTDSIIFTQGEAS